MLVGVSAIAKGRVGRESHYMKRQLPDAAAEALVELEQFVYQSAVNWQSYWSLDSKESHDRFRSVFQKHEWWYVSTREAYFMCAIISLAKFFETNPRTMNIEHFTECLKCAPAWQQEHKILVEKSAGCAIASRDIAILRSNYYAHKNRKLTQRDIFKKTSLRYDDIPRLIQSMADMLNVVVTSIRGSEIHPKSIAERTAKEMEELLGALQK